MWSFGYITSGGLAPRFIQVATAAADFIRNFVIRYHDAIFPRPRCPCRPLVCLITPSLPDCLNAFHPYRTSQTFLTNHSSRFLSSIRAVKNTYFLHAWVLAPRRELLARGCPLHNYFVRISWLLRRAPSVRRHNSARCPSWYRLVSTRRLWRAIKKEAARVAAPQQLALPASSCLYGCFEQGIDKASAICCLTPILPTTRSKRDVFFSRQACTCCS